MSVKEESGVPTCAVAHNICPLAAIGTCQQPGMNPNCRLWQIMAMSTMKDHERLELLKEIGGTKVYEERRKESMKILHETDNRRQRILEVVSHIVQTSHKLVMAPFCKAMSPLSFDIAILPAPCEWLCTPLTDHRFAIMAATVQMKEIGDKGSQFLCPASVHDSVASDSPLHHSWSFNCRSSDLVANSVGI